MINRLRSARVTMAIATALACTPVQAENIDQNTFLSKYTQAEDLVNEGSREYDVVQPFLDRGDYDSACTHLKASWRGYLGAASIYRELAGYDNLGPRAKETVTKSAEAFSRIASNVWDQKEETCKIANSLK